MVGREHGVHRVVAAAAGALLLAVTGCGWGESDPPRKDHPVVLRARDATVVSPGRGLREVASIPVDLEGAGAAPQTITTDGRLLRSREQGNPGEPGFRTPWDLLNPRNGRVTAMPGYPARYGTVVQADGDAVRIVASRPSPAVLTYDRRAETWAQVAVPRLGGSGEVAWSGAAVASGRVYLARVRPGVSTLWSFPLAGGAARQEARVAGFSAAGNLLAYVTQATGRSAVLHLRTLSTGKERTVRLTGCRVGGESDAVGGTDRRVAVRARCSSYDTTATLVLDVRGRRIVDVVLPDDSFVTAVTDRFVLLSGQYAVDVPHRELLRLTRYAYELDGWPQASARGGLLGYVDGVGGARDDRNVRLHLVRVPSSAKG